MKNDQTRGKSVGIWIRVSTEDQAQGESPQHHETRAREYAKFCGWNVKEVYDLAGVSGKTVMDHPEAKRMIADIRRGHIQCLIFSKLARLARNTRELLDFAEMFRECNADMISIQEKIDTSSPAGRLFYTMIAALSQWEREEIADRVKASIRVRASLGKTLGGPAPFGYMWKDKKLVVDPAEAPIRKLMFEMFAENKRLKGVARLLNKAGYRTRKGAKFTDTTVLRLIQDPTAKGSYRANHTYRDSRGKLHRKPEKEWIVTKVEPIVPSELWEACNAMLSNRKEKPSLGPKPVHLFAGLLFCGCGQRMYVFSKTPKYVCSKCRNKIPIQDLEEIFREELEDFFISQDKVQEHLSKANAMLAEKKERVSTHTQALQKVRTEMRKVYELYQGDRITPDGFGNLYRPLEEKERELAAELPRLQGEVAALEMKQLSASEVIAEAGNLKRLWPSMTPEEKRKIVESITERITLTGDEIDIKLSYSPSSEELTKTQRNLCVMLPSCDRVIKVAREDIAPVWTRAYPVGKTPKTLGEHLRKRRFELGLRQEQSAQKLGVSCLTMSLWETDKVFPTLPFHSRIIDYLGYDPFTNPALGDRGGNATQFVAPLLPKPKTKLSKRITKRRLELRQTRRQFAQSLGVSVKTLWGWETGRRKPSAELRSRLDAVLSGK